MIMPNFLVLGTTKSGTTSLNNYLDQHPDIYMSPVKEPRFFAFEGETLDFVGPRSQIINTSSITDLNRYSALFQGAQNEKAIGEASALYLFVEKAAQSIHRHIPDARLIAILRNPVDRAYSQFLHNVRDGYEDSNSFLEALQQDESRQQRRWEPGLYYIPWGFYSVQLQRYFQLFDKQQIKIIMYEDFENNLKSTIGEIFRFLKVDDTFVPEMSARYNVSGLPKSRTIHTLLTNLPWLAGLAKSVVPHKARRRVMDVRNRNLAKPGIPEDARKYLCDIYRRDVLDLQELIQRDLTTWLQ
jgi:Sulfotransferase family